MKEHLLRNAEETAELGARVARALRDRAGGVIYLSGELGAGKTTLARGLLRSLGVRGPIRSPTYTLLEPYDVDGRVLVHLDLYRLNDEDELESLGLRDYAPERSWWLVEWPERAAARLPAADLRIELRHVADGRQAQLAGPLAAEIKSPG